MAALSPLKIGESFSATRTLSQREFDRFAALSGDDNPIHVDPGFSARTHFGRTVSHGMLLYAVLRGLLRERFPDAVQMDQQLLFPNPAFAGEPLTVRLTIQSVDGLRLQVATVITRPDGLAAVEGLASLELAAPVRSWKGLSRGQRAELCRVFTAADAAEYAALSGEPVEAGAVPEPLIGGLFSCLLGTQLPGHGTNWLKQRLTFQRPASIGAVLTASVEVIRLRPEKDLVNLRTVCVDDEGRTVAEGEALVLVRDIVSETG
jgi:acyl dehydratase